MSDKVPVTQEGVCPHCGEKDGDKFFDNAEDEYAWCYTCGKHSTNLRWNERYAK